MKLSTERVSTRGISLAAEIVSANLASDESRGGWTYEAIAQVYKKPNDRLMYFFPNSGRKTIRDRVPKAFVKIKNGHPDGSSVRDVLGFVAEAQERQSGVRYKGFISSTEPEIADKISDRSINQNSIELIPLQTVPKPVDIDTVPEIARRFATLDADGKAILLGVKQYFWDAIGLVAASSQDIDAIISPPTMIPLQRFPVGSGDWDAPAEALRLKNWGGESYSKLSSGHLVRFYSPGGELHFAGQVASPNENGHMVISVAAIPAALEEVKKALLVSGIDDQAQSRTLAAAFDQAAAYLRRAGQRLTLSPADDIHESGVADSATESLESIATVTASSALEHAAAANSQTTAGPARPSTVGSEQADKASAQITTLDSLARIREQEQRYREVVHESAITGGGPTPGGRAGDRRA